MINHKYNCDFKSRIILGEIQEKLVTLLVRLYMSTLIQNELANPLNLYHICNLDQKLYVIINDG
jgi:hypothetical protein